jgi:hypothetical protein
MPLADTVSVAYFTVVESDRTGWTGGLLVLNASGRPLEFQCTLPVRPSRAHEILFGTSLRSHIISEVIGKLLVEKTRTPFSLLCCDQPESLSLEIYCTAPVALVSEAAEIEEGPINDDTLVGYWPLAANGGTLRVSAPRIDEAQQCVDKLCELTDIQEPFERIREAIREAHSQVARAAA